MTLKHFSLTLTLVLIGVLLTSSANAHESRPGYLQLTLTDDESVLLRFKVPAMGNSRFGLYPKLPDNCVETAPATTFFADNALTEKSKYICKGGLTGRTVRVDGLTSTLTDVLVRIERPDGTTQVTRLTPSSPEFIVEATPDAFAVAKTYLLAYEHWSGQSPRLPQHTALRWPPPHWDLCIFHNPLSKPL